MKTIFTAALLLILVPAFSCVKDSSSNTYKWSVGIILMSETYSESFGLQPNILPGITARRDLGKFRLRAATEMYLHNTRSSLVVYPDQEYITEKSFGTLLRLGIERGWMIKNCFRPYIGFDLAAGFDKITITENGGFMGIYRERFINRKSAGIMPTAGLELFINKRFSVSAETQFCFLMVSKNEKTIYYLGNVDTRPTSSTSYDFNLNRPLAVGVHFHF